MTDILAEEVVTLNTVEEASGALMVEESTTLIPVELSMPYTLSPVSGPSTLIINMGSSGPVYNGVSDYNGYETLPSGASIWRFNYPDDHIGVMAGPLINDLAALTFEIQFRLDGSGIDNKNPLWAKGQDEESFEVYVDDLTQSLVMCRATLDSVEMWRTKESTIEYGVWHTLQLPWNAGLRPSLGDAPMCILDNTLISFERVNQVPSLEMWASDEGFNAIIGNDTTLTHNLNGAISFFKLHRDVLTRHLCKTNYLGELWRLHNPVDGSMVIPSGAVQITDDPGIRVGTNASSLNVKFDYSKIVTKLYARGGGQSPSELTFSTPAYYPAQVQLKNPYTIGQWVYFDIPIKYGSFYGYTKAGDPLPAGMTVSKGTRGVWWGPWAEGHKMVWLQMWGGNQPIYTHLDHSTGFRPHEVLLFLKRTKVNPGTTGDSSPTGQWPRLSCGIYSLKDSGMRDQGGWWIWVPDKGPIVESIIDVRSVPEYQSWVSFPMPAHTFANPGRKAIVLNSYPNSSEWPTDEIWWCFSDMQGVSQFQGITSGGSNQGPHPEGWSGSNGYPHFMQLIGYETAEEGKFAQGGPRTVAVRATDYDASKPYYLHYRQNPYLLAAYNTSGPYLLGKLADDYGIIEGTYKNDALLDHKSLLMAATQYLDTVSQPVLSWEVSVIDLYDMNPTLNPTMRFELGQKIKVFDEKLGIEKDCYITKIDKPDMNRPHLVDLTLDNIATDAKKLLTDLHDSNLQRQKYLQGATVSAPYNATRLGDPNNPAMLYFEIGQSDFLPSVRLSITPQQPLSAGSPGGTITSYGSSWMGAFVIEIDGNVVTFPDNRSEEG